MRALTALLHLGAILHVMATLETQTCMQQLGTYFWSCKLRYQGDAPCWLKIDRGECGTICSISAENKCNYDQPRLPALSHYSDECASCITDGAEAFGEDNTKDCVIFSLKNKCWANERCRRACGTACGVESLCAEVLGIPQQPSTAPTPIEENELPQTFPPSQQGVPNGSPCNAASDCLDACLFDEAGTGTCQDSALFTTLDTPCVPGVTDCTCLVTSSGAACAVARETENGRGIDAATLGIIIGVSSLFVLLVALAAYVLLKRRRKPPVAKVLSRGNGEDAADVEKKGGVAMKAGASGHVLNPQSSVTVL